MIKRKYRKGFTLAELLIVVAIIAVLVAIAVPLFVGALDDAEKRVGEANCRAVRAEVVKELLLNSDEEQYKDSSGNLTGPWVATGLVTSEGTVQSYFIRSAISGDYIIDEDGKYILPEADRETLVDGATARYVKDKTGAYNVVILVTQLTVED